MVNWICKAFNELTPHELYAIIRLRNKVFVVEQDCVFQDADDKDQLCYHLSGWKNDLLVAYARLVPPGIIYEMASIGRVVTDPDTRHMGLGRQLMQEAIEKTYDLFGKNPIKIGAQLYLKNFYESFHFAQSSSVYLEDGIEHIKMIKNE